MLASLFDLVRDIAVLAAACGIAWWCWDQYKSAPRRRDEAARAGIAAERQAMDLKQWVDRIDGRTNDVARYLERLVAAGDEAEARAAAKAQVHQLLQNTTDPFLTFNEIEHALADAGRIAESAEPAAEGVEEKPKPLAGDRLRRILIELISDGAIAQLDHDRYFIASDYEAGDSRADDDGDEEAA